MGHLLVLYKKQLLILQQTPFEVLLENCFYKWAIL